FPPPDACPGENRFVIVPIGPDLFADGVFGQLPFWELEREHHARHPFPCNPALAWIKEACRHGSNGGLSGAHLPGDKVDSRAEPPCDADSGVAAPYGYVIKYEFHSFSLHDGGYQQESLYPEK